MLHEHLAICESQMTSKKRKRSYKLEDASLLSLTLRDTYKIETGRAIGDSGDGDGQGISGCMAWVASQELGLPLLQFWLSQQHRSFAGQVPHTAGCVIPRRALRKL